MTFHRSYVLSCLPVAVCHAPAFRTLSFLSTFGSTTIVYPSLAPPAFVLLELDFRSVRADSAGYRLSKPQASSTGTSGFDGVARVRCRLLKGGRLSSSIGRIMHKQLDVDHLVLVVEKERLML